MEEVSSGDCQVADEHFGLSFGTPAGASPANQSVPSFEALDVLTASYGEILQRFSVRHKNTLQHACMQQLKCTHVYTHTTTPQMQYQEHHSDSI